MVKRPVPSLRSCHNLDAMGNFLWKWPELVSELQRMDCCSGRVVGKHPGASTDTSSVLLLCEKPVKSLTVSVRLASIHRSVLGWEEQKPFVFLLCELYNEFLALLATTLHCCSTAGSVCCLQASTDNQGLWVMKFLRPSVQGKRSSELVFKVTKLPKG